jgi:hypothetical protein
VSFDNIWSFRFVAETDYSIECAATEALGVNETDFAYRVENGVFWAASFSAANVATVRAETVHLAQFSFLSQNSCLDVLTRDVPRFATVE